MQNDKLIGKLLASLKRHNPSKVRAYAGDDDGRDIAVPTRRRRWSQVIEAIEAKEWSRVELLDKSGAVLGYVDNTEGAGELRDIGSGTDGKITEVQRIVQIVINAQRDAMQFRANEVAEVMQAQSVVIKELVAGVGALGAMYREQVDAATETAAMRATAAAGDGGQLKELLDAAPTLLQMIPVLKGLLGGGDVKHQAAPPNGAAKKA